jgi:glycosyltransferase involved in cell wall biosynthesis
MRIAIVHEWLSTYAGSERVVGELLECYPQAELFAVVDVLPDDQRGFLKGKVAKTTFIQRLPFAKKRFRAYLPLMPLAIEQLDVSGYDLIISSSHAVAKGVITGPNQLHVCYCHTPMRYAWDRQGHYLSEAGLRSGIWGLAAKMMLHYLRIWDARTSNGVDEFMANSGFIARRIRKAYGRKATVVYPPVDTERFTIGPAPRGDYFFAASRFVAYKRMDVIVGAFSRLPQARLIVAGDGAELERCRRIAGSNTEFIGHCSSERLVELMRGARAFVFAAEEDFGIAPVEAQACGTPVIAYGSGGVTESVINGETGIFFSEQTSESLQRCVERFLARTEPWDAARIRASAERFSRKAFRSTLTRHVSEWFGRFRASAGLSSLTPP